MSYDLSGPVRLAVIYYSATGTVYELAKAAGLAAEKAGAEVRLRKVREMAPPDVIAANRMWSEHVQATRHIAEATLDDLDWADAIMLGAPTRYGMPAAQLKQFIDSTGPLWGGGRLINKIASSFTAAATEHGGQEATILALNNTFYHWGAIIVPPGYADPVQFRSGNPYGTSHTSQNGEIPPGETQLAAIEFQARRVVEVAQAFKRGRTV
ncbi:MULTISPECIES: NAD(P)H:quinone oxidoreductase type IV [Thermomonospora]|uniref:Flavoprotein WrbA n=1 Tax=Thermomonospora curvata (strain ATCC 19995 / DSM 43183 / JCM 3096 / KCTC 9072 / NBRC 15933 / NCIMB 10081 / Henssen B9) TaxID=471852 RepID=D1AED3_THECD|nr:MULTISPECIES: NAD(P)H:quinone oxidoreductase type IV [Thermomonospora]ACY95749.1 flavoprotein WrbA [Thermomonospora curvata DSM 43183]PKK16330.1 MAG: NAD(P)H:quinone oxidoreductase type IV [Thermomonospora sp. CIF 1]